MTSATGPVHPYYFELVTDGRTTRKHYSRGYQSALVDLIHALNNGGEAAARNWIKDNASSNTRRYILEHPYND